MASQDSVLVYSPHHPGFLHRTLGHLSALIAIKPDSGVQPVQILWSGIVFHWFPPTENYKIAVKRPALSNANQPDAVVFEVRVVSPSLVEKQILLVECKQPSLDTQTNWDNEGQVLDDVQSTLNLGNGVYSAIAIVTKVRFYFCDGQTVQGLHQNILDLHEEDGQRATEYWLDHIKQKCLV